MNGAQLHLLVNHLPVVGILFGVLAAIFAWRLRSADSKRLALGLILLAALSTLPAYFTGEPAEDVAKHVPEVQKERIHDHEEAAEVALVLTQLTAAVALVGLLGAKRWPRSADRGFAGAVIGAVVASGMLAYVAHLGGLIRHPEIAGEPRSNNGSVINP